jgi:cell wall-associated NlpC family hydrolase
MRRLIVFLFLGIFNLTAVFAQEEVLPRFVFNSVEEEIDSMIGFAKQFLGLKYRYGNNTPEGFDCSGFTGYVYSQFGYPKLGRSAADQYKDGVLVERENMKAGDLVFFKERNSNGTYRINHVGMIISVDTTDFSFNFIHSCRRGVLIDNSAMEYYQKRFYGIRRIIEN